MTGDRVRVGGRVVRLSHPDKVLFTDPGISKAELADYYRSVARVILPHVRGRPLALPRFPDGIDAGGFLQKKLPGSAPDWVGSVTVDREQGGRITMLCCQDTATLVYLADQAVLSLHPWLSRGDRPRQPDRIVFDLDPADEDFGTVRWAARTLHELLTELGLPAYPMTSGSRGLHVTVPLSRSEDFDEVRDFARRVAEELAARHPDRLTTRMRKPDRRGRLFLDTLRNSYAQHAVAPYSPRALPGAPVATPLYWEELDEKALTAQRFRIRDMAERVAAAGDPWQGMRRHARTLSTARRRLADLRDR